jgi:hypothetical protein
MRSGADDGEKAAHRRRHCGENQRYEAVVAVVSEGYVGGQIHKERDAYQGESDITESGIPFFHLLSILNNSGKNILAFFMSQYNIIYLCIDKNQ